MKQRIIDRFKDDTGDSLVSFIIVIAILAVMVFTIPDFAIFQKNQAAIQTIARDGATTVAVLGGNESSKLSKTVGVNDNCTELDTRLYKGSTVGKSATECEIIHRISAVEGKGIGNIVIYNVHCAPRTTTEVNETTFCEIEWESPALAGSLRAAYQAMAPKAKHSNLTCGTAAAEVAMNPNGIKSTEKCSTSVA